MMQGPAHIRAKFRCLAIEERYDKTFTARLSPVMQRGENSEENRRFWEASPSGECTLNYNAEHDLQNGAYYYIDMVLKSDGDWELSGVSLGSNGNGEVNLSHYKSYDYKKPTPAGMLRGELKIGIDRGKTPALEMFGKPGSKWDVSFTFAEPSSDD